METSNGNLEQWVDGEWEEVQSMLQLFEHLICKIGLAFNLHFSLYGNVISSLLYFINIFTNFDISSEFSPSILGWVGLFPWLLPYLSSMKFIDEMCKLNF
jgi:hypothetical protein